MRANTVFKVFIATLASFALGAFVTACDESPSGPVGPDGYIPDPTSLKDSADSAKYFHALYKGKWLCIKDSSITYWPGDQFIPAGWDTTDRLAENEYLIYQDTTFFHKFTTHDTTFRDIRRYKVTNTSFCGSSYGDNYVNYACTPHTRYFKGPDTLDLSDYGSFGDKHVWVFVRAK